MIIDNAIQMFLEKYDESSMASIKELSERYGLNINGYKIKVFNINEAFDKFKTYLEGYASYKAENVNNPDASPQDAIVERTSTFIDTDLVKEVSIKYSELPSFIESYVSGINNLIESVNKIQTLMTESDVDQDAIGDVSGFCDKFMEKVDPLFEECMDRILWASGYKSRQALIEKKDTRPTAVKHVFL